MEKHLCLFFILMKSDLIQLQKREEKYLKIERLTILSQFNVHIGILTTFEP
jgi:hypothetical protein